LSDADFLASDDFPNARRANLRPHDSSNACVGVKRIRTDENNVPWLLDFASRNENHISTDRKSTLAMNLLPPGG
jgi:hypothetical protein